MLVAVALAGGCGPSASDCGRAEVSAEQRGNSPALEHRLDAPLRVRVAPAVPLYVIVTNCGSDPAEFTTNPPPDHFDVTIRRCDGSVVWNRLGDRAISAVGITEMLIPSERRVFRTWWLRRDNQGYLVPAGRYRVQGYASGDTPERIMVVEPLFGGPAPGRSAWCP
jgi:hypothetical protein